MARGAKGRSFEETVHALLDQIAGRPRRCRPPRRRSESTVRREARWATRWSSSAPADGPCLATVRFRSQDNRKLSKNDAWIELNGAMAERDAVLRRARRRRRRQDSRRARRSQRVPGEQDDRRLSTATSPTRWRWGRLVYRYVRARVLLGEGRRGLDVDAAGVRDAAEGGRGAAEVCQSKSQVTDQRQPTAPTVPVRTLTEMIADVERCARADESLVSAAADSSRRRYLEGRGLRPRAS